MGDQNDKKRGRSLVEVDLHEVKRLREDLLESSEDDDICTTTRSEDLDSFMKIFEDEITQTPKTVVSDLGFDLGFLLEASDDELGLPPSTDGLSELWELEDQMRSFDSFEVGDSGTEYVELDALFDYHDLGLGFGPPDFPQTLPAQ